MPADEVVLIYTTISISSTCEAAQVAALDAELAELEGPAGFGCAQVRCHRVSLFGQQSAAGGLLGAALPWNKLCCRLQMPTTVPVAADGQGAPGALANFRFTVLTSVPSTLPFPHHRFGG